MLFKVFFSLYFIMPARRESSVSPETSSQDPEDANNNELDNRVIAIYL